MSETRLLALFNAVTALVGMAAIWSYEPGAALGLLAIIVIANVARFLTSA